MKNNIYVVSCDWYAVSCVSDWCGEFVERPAGKHCEPRSFIGMSFEYGGERFSLETSREYNPAYCESLLAKWHGRPLALLFFRPRRQDVDARSCQAKVANSALYSSTWPSAFRSLLRAISWQFVRVARVDVCADFEFFANGRLPLKFAQDYLSRPTSTRPSFIRKSSNKFRTAGVKAFDKVLWETISWGTRDSAVQVNLYNKTKELMSKEDKAYIREKWKSYGLPSSLEKPVKRFVWRVEFSINPSAKFVYDPLTRRCRELLQSDVETQRNLDELFRALVPDFFQFYFITTADKRAGRRVKDLEPVVLFADIDQAPYKLRSYVHATKTGRTEKILLRRLDELIRDGNLTPEEFLQLKTLQKHLQVVMYDKDKQAAGEVTSTDVLQAFFRRLTRTQRKPAWMSDEQRDREVQRIVTMLFQVKDQSVAHFDAGFRELNQCYDYLADSAAQISDYLPEWFFDVELDEQVDEEYWQNLLTDSNVYYTEDEDYDKETAASKEFVR